ncbi:MAG: hypothetical protein ACRYG8_05545 [Janthinobacterium lividum]
MSLLSWLFRFTKKPVVKTPKLTAARALMPTVKFDASLIDVDAETNLRRQVEASPEFKPHHQEAVYKAALKSILVGGDLDTITRSIMTLKIEGLEQRRAKEIALSLLRKTREPARRKRTKTLGIVHAQWVYAGVPCSADGKSDPHKSLNGKRYTISKGMMVNGKRIWPGEEDHCRCISKSIIPGLN